MKVAVLGASGGTGMEVVQQSLAAGHEVTAIVRKPEAFKLHAPNLQAVAGDALDLHSFTSSLEGQDAVISAVGVSSLVESLKPMTFYHDTAANIIEAMSTHHVQRFLCITSVGVHNNPKAPLYYKALVHPLLSHKYEDMRQMETIVRESGLEWTIVRPASLSHGKWTGQYTLAADSDLERTGSISRADVADFLLKALIDPAYVQHAVAISY